MPFANPTRSTVYRSADLEIGDTARIRCSGELACRVEAPERSPAFAAICKLDWKQLPRLDP